METGDDSSPSVVLSLGHGHSHLALLVPPLMDSGQLDLLMTGAWPTAAWSRTVGRWATVAGPIQRLLDRGELVPEERLDASWISELLFQVGQQLWHLQNAPSIQDNVAISALRWRARTAEVTLRERPLPEGSWVYHYRSGYGGTSVAIARRRGAVVLCDHSIAHPRALGAIAKPGVESRNPRFWKYVEKDLDRCDYLLVNSDYVYRTMPEKLQRRTRVVYTGWDTQFAAALRQAPTRKTTNSPGLRILIAGTMEYRKGSDLLSKVCKRIDALTSGGVTFQIVGDWDPSLREVHRQLRAIESVRLAGRLSQPALAAAMRHADVFLFPTRAEGSARVVAEAQLAGCFVLTTEEAGSFVSRGVGGRLIRADVESISEGILWCANNISDLRQIAAQDSLVIQDQLSPQAYICGVMKTYEDIVAGL